mgnify:CR=1 FL=1
MFYRKNFRRLLVSSLAVGSLFFMPITDAAIETYVGTGEYVMSSFETPDIAQQRAQVYAERDAQEQAGVFIRSQSRLENFTLTQDVIQTMTAGIIKILDVKVQPEIIDAKTIKYKVTVTANIDTAEIERWLEQEAQVRIDLIDQNRELRRRLEEQEAELARLKAQTATSDREELEREFQRADAQFLAIEKNSAGYRTSNHAEALKLYSEAIELDPMFAMAYNNRGYTYTELGQYDRAMSDLNRAIELDPQLKLAYNNRGRVFSRWRQYDRAVMDYNRAIELDPNYATPYNNRGYVYDELKQYELAIADYTRAIELNPTFTMAYNNRGFAHISLKQYERAISDLSRAIEIDAKFAWAYNNRGTAYLLTGDIDKALRDFDKAIECDSRYAKAYKNRGYCYKALGDDERAQADFDKAKSLGN